MTRIIILAAGKGTRMNSELPKALVPLKDRAMIRYLIDSAISSQVDNKPIVVVSPENIESIRQELKDFNLEYAIQEKQLGTGHAVACVQATLERSDVKPDKLIILYCDHPFIKKESMKLLAELNVPTVAIMPTILPDFSEWRQNFYHWGRIIRGVDSRVEKIIEFKDASEEEKLVTEVNPGIMCFNTEWLLDNISRLQNNNSQQEYYLTDMVKLSFEDGNEISTVSIEPHEAMGINSVEELNIAEELIN